MEQRVHWRACASLIFLSIVAAPVVGGELMPLAGSYFRDIPCKGDGSERPDLLVKITKNRIESEMAACDILNWGRDGKTILAHVECKVAGGQPLLGDVTFTFRDDGSLDFKDQDHTSDAILHRCTK
jgi:hypothetical protein